jgi:polysaccharide biosynthesis/export protein
MKFWREGYMRNITDIRQKAKGIHLKIAGKISCLLLLILLVGCNGFKQVPRYQPSVAKARFEAALREAEAARNLMQTSPGVFEYRIHPTDIIEIKVYEYDEMNLATRVSIDGRINLPPLGDIPAAGLTTAELESKLRDALKGTYLKEPKVIVTVKEATSQNITILGEVKSPGLQAVWGQTSLLDVLAKVGGVTERANRVAYLSRPEPKDAAPTSATQAALLSPTTLTLPASVPGMKTYQIYLARLLQNADEAWNIPVLPGDVMTVPSAGSVHVTGPYIEKPGTYPLSFAPITLRQAIDIAGGLKWGASRDIILSRKDDSGETRFSKVNFNQALKQSDYDIVLEPEDRLIVVSSPWRHTLDLFRRGLLTLTATFRATDTTTVGVGTNALFVK